MKSRRQVTQALITLPAMLLTGCATQDVPQADDTETYCVKTGLKKRRICTPERIPPASVEAEAKRFEPTPNAFTLFVVRSAWIDRAVPLKFAVDETKQVGTLPRTLVRLRMSPGRHKLSFEWDGRTRSVEVEGRSGEVKFVEIAGASTLWAESYFWSDADPAGARERARKSRLVADF